MLKRYKMYYNEAVGKIEMYGEERKIIDFMPILEKYFNRKPCKVIEMTGEPDYGVGDFRIG